MRFRGIIVSAKADAYKGTKGDLDNTICTCLDADPVKLNNTVDIKIPTGDLKLLGVITPCQTVGEFDVEAIEFFANRIRMRGNVVAKKA